MTDEKVDKAEEPERSLTGGSSKKPQLTENAKLTEALLETVGALVVVLDRDGRIVQFNHACEKASGYSFDEVRGRRVWDFLIVPEEVEAVRGVFERLAGGDFPNEFENSWVAKDGSRRLIAWSNTALLDEHKRVQYVIGTGLDITERERIQEGLREREARLRAIVDTAVEGIITICERGIIESFNRAAEHIFGYRANEVIGQNVKILMPMPYRAEHDGYLHRYLETGKKKIIGIGREVTGQRKDGTTFPMDISVSEVLVGDRRVFTGIVRDISEQVELRAKLAQAERLAAVGELAAGIAHEVNNPVNTIINCAQLLKDGDRDPSLWDDILDEGKRISAIVKNLLNFARDDRERRHPTSIRQVLELTLSLIGRRLNRQGIVVHTEVGDELPPVLASPQELQQVLLNFFLNARDALLQPTNAPGRQIDIRAENCLLNDRPGVRFSVRDNGPGIRPEDLERIFQPFYTTKRGQGGTGLGLSVSKSIVEKHGGLLEVSSTFGEFTEFCVTLPAQTGSEEETP